MNPQSPSENPVDYLIRRFGITRLDMTLKYGFGANHLLLAAQGRKDSLGAILLSAFDIEAASHGLVVDDLMQEGYGQPDLPSAWEAWRREARQDVQIPSLPATPDGLSPWGRIVDQFGSVAKTSKTLRVRDLVVDRYLSKPNMPSSLREALEDTGWSGVGDLEQAQQEFFRV
jgi:hypothetical protein